MTDKAEELEALLDSSRQEVTRLRAELQDKENFLNDANEKLSDVSAKLALTEKSEKNLQALISPGGDHVAAWRVTLLNNLGLVITGFIVLAVVIAVIAFFYDSEGAGSGAGALIKQLADPGAARGLITFLVVVGTVVMGLLLLISSFRTAEGSAESFTRGKEIFTILVGILGTIVGFYFGVGPDKDQDSVPSPNVVEQQIISDTGQQKTGDDGGVSEVKADSNGGGEDR